MERIVKHITDRLVDQLPDDKEAYKLNDLRQHGFPRFVIKRIVVELERNLSESIILPETEWAQMDSDEVRHAWEQFVSAIRSQARLPESYTYAVVETAISDIIDILVQPRKNLPDIIFGASDTLEYDELLDRMDAIVVYRHFASLIPRYMEKRGHAELSKEQCEKIVAQADEKLTANYTPLNWAQMLEPLFLLLKERIDSNLLRLFFQDKNKPRVARRFDLMNKALNRSELIEELSTPDLPDDDDQNELFSQVPPQNKKSTGWEGLVKPAERESTSESRDEQQDDQSQQQPYEENGEEKEEETNLNTLYSEETEEDESGEQGNADEENRDTPLNTVFEKDTSDEDDKPEESESEQADSDQHIALKATDNSDDEIVEELSQDQEPEDQDEEGIGAIEPTEDEAEVNKPMWQRFMSPEEEDQWDQSEEKAEDEVYEPEESEEEIDQNEEDEFEEEPLIDLTTDQGPDKKEYERLHHLLDDARERFVEEIFRGGDEAYEEAVREIATKEDWRSASQFIEKEVFKRNLVDMYSEVAVDFTDRLHSYFMETTKSN